MYELSFKAFGERSILIEWPDGINDKVIDDVSRMRDALTQSLKNSEEIVDVVAAYNSLTIIHRHNLINFPRRVDILKKIYAQAAHSTEQKKYIFTIPVCYHPSLAQDLKFFMQTTGLELAEIIDLHVRPLYRVCFLGFLPGFLYLSGLDKALQLPRKSTPDPHIPKGSVAIGGGQTGIYPHASPGGWHVIGKSPLQFFNASIEPVCFAQGGDYIRFQSIGIEEYNKLVNDIAQDKYQIQSEPYHA
ncbi:MAG: 5-oxoprolinase subunit PxpB [Gammaproteobacteria bacterium]|nr:5-oxoprolinase subunit PxpB [Gammaproteobacteria bacterium]NNC96916.1 5-oxoprolinase subunit PxpB [Gammaproteobacteria bacterium]NNM13331.1 5-oxoprolinase subunit PxpB [Gammaproteobacteria bacterium]